MPGQTILVIDTDLETMQRMISILESEDYLVFTASNRESSITMAKKVNPSLIFINIAMSGVSGLEISKMIHETETLQEIPLIIVTPHGGTVDPRYTSVYGIVDFMPKEFSPEDLVATTKTVLGQQPESPQLFEEDKFEEPTEETLSEKPVSEDTPIIQEEPTVQVNIQEEPELHRDEEVTPQEEPLLEEFADLSKEEPSETGPFLEEEEQEATPPPVFSEIIEEPPLDDQPEKSEEFVSPKIVEPEKKKSTSKTLPLLILLLIIVAGVGIFYYTTQRESETPLETASVISDQELPEEAEQTIQPEESKTKASEADKPQSKPSPASQTKPEKPKAHATTPSVKKLSTPAPSPKKSPAVSTAPKQTKQTYSVQVGAFRDKLNAVAYTKQLVEKGYDARVHKTDLADKGALYRVLIGKFDQKKEASQMARTVRMKEKVSTVLFRE